MAKTKNANQIKPGDRFNYSAVSGRTDPGGAIIWSRVTAVKPGRTIAGDRLFIHHERGLPISRAADAPLVVR